MCVNALTLFYSYGRGHQLAHTLHWVREVLLHRAYLYGTRYYAMPECFLYFLGRLLETTNDTYLAAYLKPLLIERVQERIGAEGDALALSMRLCVCAYLGLRNDVDLRTLLPLQCEDGGWEIGWVYRYGVTGISIGNRGLTTSLAIKAILGMQRSSTPSPPSKEPAVPLSKQAHYPDLLCTSCTIIGASLKSPTALLQGVRSYPLDHPQISSVDYEFMDESL